MSRLGQSTPIGGKQAQEFLMDSLPRAKCRGCKAEIAWATTWAGSPIPLDPEPRPDGNVVLSGGGTLAPPGRLASPPEIRAVALAGETLRLLQPGTPRYVAHFATCPNAGDFQHSKRTAEPKTRHAGKKL